MLSTHICIQRFIERRLRHSISILACLLTLSGGFAQFPNDTLIQSVFATTGTFVEDTFPPGSGLSLSYTVGEMVIKTGTSLSGTFVLTQGFQQPNLRTVGIDDLEIELGYHVYPNPTTGPLMIELNSSQPLILYLAIYDLIGQQTLIPRQEARLMGKFTTQMDLSSLSDGVYLLAIINEKKRIIRTLRIEKYF